jgi:hypothetical protein
MYLIKCGKSQHCCPIDLRVFERRVLRRIFGPKIDEVTGDWRRFA